MKKFISTVLSTLLICSTFFVMVPTQKVDAYTTSFGVTPGGATTRTTARTQNVSVYYTKNEAARIANASDRIANIADYASLILGIKNPPIGGAAFWYSKGLSNTTRTFKTAQARGTGVEISYTVTIQAHTTVPLISNSRVVYR